MENVITFIPEGVPKPFDQYYLMRNGYVGEQISQLAQIPYQGAQSLTRDNLVDAFQDGNYPVLPKPISADIIDAADITSPEAMYGAATEDLTLFNKSTLHPLVDGRPFSYGVSKQFMQDIEGLVLPGFTVTGIDDIDLAMAKLKDRGIHNLRLKSADASNGEGQFNVNSASEAIHYFKEYDLEVAVIEERIMTEVGKTPRNISLGISVLPNVGTFAVISEQIDIPKKNGQVIYGGADCMAFAIDSIQDVLPIVTQLERDSAVDSDYAQSIINAANYIQLLLAHHNTITSRIAVDTLNCKVVDMAGRVTGVDPMLSQAIGRLLHGENIVRGSVKLNYGRNNFSKNYDAEAMRFYGADQQIAADHEHDLQIVVNMK